MKNFLKFATLICIIVAGFVLSACERDAQVASRNLSYKADQFEIARRVVFFNGITDTYLLEIQGLCSLGGGSTVRSLTVTCKTASGFKKHYLGLSDNVSWFTEQLNDEIVSTNFYKVSFKPTTIIPDIDLNVE